MSKLYYPTPDELVLGNSNRLADPITEARWFRRHQNLLVLLANTHEGRELLCIDSWKDMPLPIIGISTNEVRFDASRELGPRTYISDFRVGANWGNVIRWRWQAVKKALDRLNLQHLLSLPQLVLYEGRKLAVPCGAATLTEYPDPHPETTTCDGNMHAYYAANVYSAFRTHAGSGGSGNYYPRWGWSIDTDYSSPGWFNTNYRGGFLFDTSALTTSATITAATIGLYCNLKTAAWAGVTSMTWGIYTIAPASNTGFVAGDYNSLGSTIQAPLLTYASTTVSAYNTFTLNATGEGNISKTGVSKYGCQNTTYDVLGTSMPASGGAGISMAMYFRGAETTGGVAPKLIVTYTLPATAAVTGEIGDGASEQEVRSAT